MNILVTGSTGFLGQNICNSLNNQFNIFGLSRSKADYILGLSTDSPNFNNNFDMVIHTAGLAHNNTKSKNNLFLANCVGTLNLLKSLSYSPPKVFVFISTVAVYGLSTGEGISEDTSLLATDPYGHSKIKAEELVQEWCAKNKVVCTILRLPLVVGTNPPGNLGAMIIGIQKGYYFNIDGGKAKKSMVLAEDVAKFVIKASDVGGIFNLTDGYHPSFYELSNLIAAQLGKNKPLNLPLIFAHFGAKFGDLIGSKVPINSDKLQKITSNLTFDDSKARAAFGWNPTPVLKGFNII